MKGTLVKGMFLVNLLREAGPVARIKGLIFHLGDVNPVRRAYKKGEKTNMKLLKV